MDDLHLLWMAKKLKKNEYSKELQPCLLADYWALTHDSPQDGRLTETLHRLTPCENSDTTYECVVIMFELVRKQTQHNETITWH